MKRFILLFFLSLSVAISSPVSAPAQLLSNHGVIGSSYVSAGPSASSLTSGHAYKTGRDMYIFQPTGYSDNSNNYPLIIFFGGDGTRGTDITLYISSGEGIMDYINQGDKPPGVLICSPQIPSGDYTLDDFDKALLFMTTNYRINTNRVYVTGLSRGAFACRLIEQSYYAQVAAFMVYAGNYNSGWTFANYTDIGNWWHNGTADLTVTNGNESFMSGANDIALDMNVSWLVTNYWGEGHTGTVWNTNGYNRRDRTDATGTAKYDYVKWLKKFSKDQLERATLHVEYAESEITIQDYRLALIQVNALTAGVDKTALLLRLTVLKTTIDNGGKRYIIDHGPSTQTTTGNVNNQTTHTAGASISSLIDDAGGSSSIGFTIVNQFASTAREGNLTSDRLRGRYFGLERNTYRDGMQLSTTITNGRCKYTGLNNAKTYNIRFYVSRSNNLTAHPEISITIGGTTKTQYCELNCTEYIEFTNLSPSSAEIIIDASNSGDTNTYIVAMELFLNP